MAVGGELYTGASSDETRPLTVMSRDDAEIAVGLLMQDLLRPSDVVASGAASTKPTLPPGKMDAPRDNGILMGPYLLSEQGVLEVPTNANGESLNGIMQPTLKEVSDEVNVRLKNQLSKAIQPNRVAQFVSQIMDASVTKSRTGGPGRYAQYFLRRDPVMPAAPAQSATVVGFDVEDALKQYKQALDQTRHEFEPGKAAWTPIKEALARGALSSADRAFLVTSIQDLHAIFMEQFAPLPCECLRDRQRFVRSTQDTARWQVRSSDTYHDPVTLDFANPDDSKTTIISGIEDIAGRLEAAAVVSEGSVQRHGQLMVDMRKTGESMSSTSSKMEATGEKLDKTGDRMEVTEKGMAVTGEKLADNVARLERVLETFAGLVTQMASEACEKALSGSALKAAGPLHDMQAVKTAVSAQVQGMILSSVNARVKRDAPIEPADVLSAIADQLHTDDDEGSDTDRDSITMKTPDDIDLQVMEAVENAEDLVGIGVWQSIVDMREAVSTQAGQSEVGKCVTEIAQAARSSQRSERTAPTVVSDGRPVTAIFVSHHLTRMNNIKGADGKPLCYTVALPVKTHSSDVGGVSVLWRQKPKQELQQQPRRTRLGDS